MKKLTNKSEYFTLFKLFVDLDIVNENSILKKVVLNNCINYLYLKLDKDKKSTLLEILKDGINEDFTKLVTENLTKEDFVNIVKESEKEVIVLYNQALITNTNGK